MAVEESKRPIGQQLALKIKARNPALKEDQVAGMAAAILAEADNFCFPGWWTSSSVDTELTNAFLFLIIQRFPDLGLLSDDIMDFIDTLVQVRKSKHYKPGSKESI